MVAITAILSSAIMAMFVINVNAAPSVLEARANERLAITLYTESGANRCHTPITSTDPRFPNGVFRPGKDDVNKECYLETPHNSVSIDYVQDPKRNCRGMFLPME